MKKLLRFALWVVLLFSLVLSILTIEPYISRKISERYPPCFELTTGDDQVVNAVLSASMKMKKPVMVTNEPRGFPSDILDLFRPKRGARIINNFYESYNLVGLSYYAFKQKREDVARWCIRMADNYIDNGKLSYELKHINQVPIGIFYINVYRLTQDDRYLQIASSIYQWLINNKQSSGGVIQYCDEDNEYVDGLGMFVPFLIEYYDITKDSLAKQLAVNSVIEFQKYGVDKNSCVPFHGYNLETKMIVGSANWGRGIGWYLLALSYLPELSSDALDDSIKRMPYTQFPLSSSRFDSSTALFFELYKHIVWKTDVCLDFIRTHIRTNGLITDCSGDVYNINRYNFAFGDSELCNGIFLMLVSL